MAEKKYTEEEIASILAGNKPEGMSSTTYHSIRYRYGKKEGAVVAKREPKYDQETINQVLAGNKPEGMSNTTYHSIRYRYGKKLKKADENVQTDAAGEIPESNDAECPTTVVESDGTVRVISSSEV